MDTRAMLLHGQSHATRFSTAVTKWSQCFILWVWSHQPRFFLSYFQFQPRVQQTTGCGWGQGQTGLCFVHMGCLFLLRRRSTSEPSSSLVVPGCSQSIDLARSMLLAPICLSKTSRTAYGPRHLPNAWATNLPSPDFRKPTGCQTGG